MTDVHPESGKAADADRIIDLVFDELGKIGISEGSTSIKKLNWDDPFHRRMVREGFDDGGAGEAILPGFGETGTAENARDDCGNPHPFVCNSCGHAVELGRTCGMSVCGRCAQVWTRDSAIQKTAKVRRVRKEEEKAIDQLWQKEHHIILSPPPGWYADLARHLSREEAQERTKAVVKAILEEFRAQGVLVRHSYRGENDDGTLASESDDRGEWKKRLNAGREWFDDVRDELAWKPHYHAIVVSDWIRVKNDDPDDLSLSEQVEEATGWVIHRIEDDDGVSLETDGDMARALTYSISHADVDVREDAHNRSAIWEIGSFQGDPIKSSGRFSPRPHDIEWADAAVRRIAWKILGIKSGTTDCGANIPDVDDPDELARRILEQLYPDDDDLRSRITTDQVLHQISEGNIDVDVQTSAGSGGAVTINHAFGMPTAGTTELPRTPGTTDLPPKHESTDLPSSANSWYDRWSESAVSNDTPLAKADDECGCGVDHDHDDVDDEGDQDQDQDDRDHDHRDRDAGDTCNGTLIPLGEARQQGLLDSPSWCRRAAHVDEARQADRDWPDDLEPWKTSSPGKSSPAIG